MNVSQRYKVAVVLMHYDSFFHVVTANAGSKFCVSFLSDAEQLVPLCARALMYALTVTATNKVKRCRTSALSQCGYILKFLYSSVQFVCFHVVCS